MEFTEEQEKYIESLIEDRTANLFTEEELDRRVTSEVDRRVESGIQKGLETHRAKWEEEFKTNAQLTAEELAQKQYEDKLNELSKQESELSKRANTIEAMDLLSGAEIPKDNYSEMLELLVSDDADRTKENVNKYIETFTSTKKELESKIKKELSNIPPPDKGGSDAVMTRDEFDNMTYLEKVELKNNDRELYDKLIK